MKKTDWITGLTPLAVMASDGSQTAQEKARPNIIYFVCHDLGRMISPYRTDIATDRKSTRLNSSHSDRSRMPSSA